MIDTRRRGNGVAQVFPTEESLKEYIKRTASYFPYNTRNGGNLLRELLRKPRNETVNNNIRFPLFPPPSVRDKRLRPKDKARPILSSRGEARSTKRKQIIKDSAEGIVDYSYADFESE